MPPKIVTTLKESNEHKIATSPRKISKDTSGNVRHNQESNITQILSQRLGNMEQQLALLRGDLKDAVETLKNKDQEITTLENKIALAERRRDAEKNGGSPDEDLRDLSEDIDPKSKSKQELLQKECDTLAQKLQEMEKFFGEYSLAWVKEDVLDEKDPNNLWHVKVRKTNIHYTPDFDKIFLVVEELNVGSAEPQIVKTGNTAQFKTADLLNLTLYSDGIQLENNPFRHYESPSVEEFFRDLEDGYFPTELKGQHPEGVIFKVKDMRNRKFADDPNRRLPVRRGENATSSPRRMSTSSVSHGPQKSSPGRDVKCESEKDLNVNACKTPRRSRTLSRKGSISSRRSIMKNIIGKATEAPKVADGKMQPQDSATPAPVAGNPKLEGATGVLESAEAPKVSSGAVTGTDTIISPEKGGTTSIIITSPGAEGKIEGGVIEGADSIKNKEGADGAAPSSGIGTGNEISTNNATLDPLTNGSGLKQLFVGKSPQVSTTRVPQPPVMSAQKTELDKELTKDSFGLPRPPLSSSASDRLKDLPHSNGPPSKHFDNYFLNTAEGTQTSGTYVIPQAPQPQPTHVTNITYNEAPITIQMTPSELKEGERKTTPTALNICPIHHPGPCDCAHGPPPSAPEEDGGIGPIGLIRIPGETEYREKYTEGAINTTNVLQQKKKSQEQGKKICHEGSAKIASPPTVLLPQDVAPIPPDPVPMGAAIDPNVQWPNFVYFGHPKGQEASPPPPTPVSPPITVKKKPDSPQIIQLNEKTSDRMISVKMKTKSGHKEFNANLYPEEPVKKLWSLLKLNDKEYSLSSTQAPHKPLKRGSIGEHSKDNDLSLVLSIAKNDNVPTAKNTGSVYSTKNYQPTKAKSGAKTSSTEGVNNKKSKNPKTELGTSSREGISQILDPATKAKSELKATSKEGSNITNVNISINIDSHTSHNGKQSPEKQKNMKNYEESKLSERSKSVSHGEVKDRPVVAPVTYPPKKQKDSFSQLKLPITPKTRAQALSEHLSQSSLHRKSFQSISYRDSIIKGSVHMEPVLLDVEGHDKDASNSKENLKTTGSKEYGKPSTQSSTGRVSNKVDSPKNMSNQKGPVITEDFNSETKPTSSLASSQSLKRFDKRTSSKSSLTDKRFSGSKLSLEKKGRRSSKSLIGDDGKKTDNLINKPSRSPSRVPVVPTDTEIGIQSATQPSLEHEKMVDQDLPGVYVTPEKDNFKGRNSPENASSVADKDDRVSGNEQANEVNRNSHSAEVELSANEKKSPVPSHSEGAFGARKSSSPGRQPTQTPIGNIADPDLLGTTLTERRVSNNNGTAIAQEKHDIVQTPGRGMFHTDKPLSPDEEPTRNDMEPDVQRPDNEMVTPILEEIVNNFRFDNPTRPKGDRPDTTEQNIHPLADMEGQKKSVSPEKNVVPTNADDDQSHSPGDYPKIRVEGTVTSLKDDDNVIKEVREPNADPPHIKLSDADLRDEKEAKMSSVSHDSKHEYDKHDSEQEFKRETITDTTTIPTNEGDQNQSAEKIDKREEKNVETPKKKTGNKNKKRKSSENKEDGTEKNTNSQERDIFDENGEKKEDLVSPVISKEDIELDNTKEQNAEDISESSLT